MKNLGILTAFGKNEILPPSTLINLKKGGIIKFITPKIFNSPESFENDLVIQKSEFIEDFGSYISFISTYSPSNRIIELPIVINMSRVIEKSMNYGGSTANVGEIRIYGGKEYQKTGDPNHPWMRFYGNELKDNPELFHKNTISTKYSRVKEYLKNNPNVSEETVHKLLAENIPHQDESHNLAIINRLKKEKILDGPPVEVKPLPDTTTVEEVIPEGALTLGDLKTGSHIRIKMRLGEYDGILRRFESSGKVTVFIPKKRAEIQGVSPESITHAYIKPEGEEETQMIPIVKKKIQNFNKMGSDYNTLQDYAIKLVEQGKTGPELGAIRTKLQQLATDMHSHPSLKEGIQVKHKDGTIWSIVELTPDHIIGVNNKGDEHNLFAEDLTITDQKAKAQEHTESKNMPDIESEDDDIEIEGDEELSSEASKQGTAQKEEDSKVETEVAPEEEKFDDSQSNFDYSSLDYIDIDEVGADEAREFEVSPQFSAVKNKKNAKEVTAAFNSWKHRGEKDKFMSYAPDANINKLVEAEKKHLETVQPKSSEDIINEHLNANRVKYNGLKRDYVTHAFEDLKKNGHGIAAAKQFLEQYVDQLKTSSPVIYGSTNVKQTPKSIVVELGGKSVYYDTSIFQ